MAFKQGDTVRVKSGSAIMTVEEVKGDGKIAVCWQDEKMNIRREVFPEAVLDLEDSA